MPYREPGRRAYLVIATPLGETCTEVEVAIDDGGPTVHVREPGPGRHAFAVPRDAVRDERPASAAAKVRV